MTPNTRTHSTAKDKDVFNSFQQNMHHCSLGSLFSSSLRSMLQQKLPTRQKQMSLLKSLLKSLNKKKKWGGVGLERKEPIYSKKRVRSHTHFGHTRCHSEHLCQQMQAPVSAHKASQVFVHHQVQSHGSMDSEEGCGWGAQLMYCAIQRNPSP